QPLRRREGPPPARGARGQRPLPGHGAPERARGRPRGGRITLSPAPLRQRPSMFVHESQLRHVLRPEHYYSEEHYRRELEHVLLPGWHPVATLAELPRGGRFVARTLLGRPLLLRRAGDEVHAFLNACAHRRRDDDLLAGVRSALCGELVFVCLADEGPSL